MAQEFFELPDGKVVCCNPGGRFHGWLFYRHPDGQLISERKLPEAERPFGDTCYPGEGPLPCPRKFALRDCWRSAVLDETQGHIVRLKNRDRRPDEELLLNYLKRVRCALEL
jgi:hypothetical protein